MVRHSHNWNYIFCWKFSSRNRVVNHVKPDFCYVFYGLNRCLIRIQTEYIAIYLNPKAFTNHWKDIHWFKRRQNVNCFCLKFLHHIQENWIKPKAKFRNPRKKRSPHKTVKKLEPICEINTYNQFCGIVDLNAEPSNYQFHI